jgi:glycosyltransferase involved in cell wall biosynthesis
LGKFAQVRARGCVWRITAARRKERVMIEDVRSGIRGAVAPTPSRAPLRILHVAEAFGGGLYGVVRSLADGAVEQGHEVAVAYGRRPETPEHPERDFRPEVLLRAMSWGGRSAIEQARAMRQQKAFAIAWRPDVIHLHSSFAGVFGGFALRGTAPIVFTPHAFASCLRDTTPAKRRAMVAGERWAVACADLIGAVSESEARSATRRGAKNVVVVPNGIPELNESALVDAQLQMLAMTSPDRPRVIAGGRISGQRRPKACARILGALHDCADVRWAGGGGNTGAWGEQARRALRDADVEVTGWLPRARWTEELSGATAYLHWTGWDGMPLSILEALATDTIVVASDIAPNREILPQAQLCRTEGEAALLLRRIVSSTDFAAELLAGQRARRERFSEDRMVAEWLEIYARTAGVPGISAPTVVMPPVEFPAAGIPPVASPVLPDLAAG